MHLCILLFTGKITNKPEVWPTLLLYERQVRQSKVISRLKSQRLDWFNYSHNYSASRWVCVKSGLQWRSLPLACWVQVYLRLWILLKTKYLFIFSSTANVCCCCAFILKLCRGKPQNNPAVSVFLKRQMSLKFCSYIILSTLPWEKSFFFLSLCSSV